MVLLWKILKKSKKHYKTSVFWQKRVVKPSLTYGFGPWNSHTRLEKLWGTLTDKLFRECWNTIGFTVFSLKDVEKLVVSLCFRSKMLKNHWFYCVFAQKGWKTIGFTVFSLQNDEKPLVLLCFRSKMLKNQWFYCVFAQKYWKSNGFTLFSLKKVEKPLVLL